MKLLIDRDHVDNVTGCAMVVPWELLCVILLFTASGSTDI